jgi:hypothetical protein
VNESTAAGSTLPTSFAVGDHLNWDSPLVPVHLVVELPYFLMLEIARIDVEFHSITFEMMISDQDFEVFVGEFTDARRTCGYQGNGPDLFESRDDVKALNLPLIRRKQRTTIYLKTQCNEDVLNSVYAMDDSSREAFIYLETLCEAHIPVINELVRRYRLMTYDYFAYEVQPWDIPVWHVRGGKPGHVSVPLFHYASLQSRPWIDTNLLKRDVSEEDRAHRYQLTLTSVNELAAVDSSLAVPGEDDLLDARNLMERGDYNGAIRRATTALEALVEYVLRQELLKQFDPATVEDRLLKSQNDFPGRLRQWQRLSGVKLNDSTNRAIDRLRTLRHEVVHRGRRLSYEERGLAQQCVDTGRWAFNAIQRDQTRTQLREFTNMTVRAIARPTLALRFPVTETPTGFQVRSLRSEFSSSESCEDFIEESTSESAQTPEE